MISLKPTKHADTVILTIQFEHKGRTIVLEKLLPTNDPIETANRLQSTASEIRKFV